VSDSVAVLLFFLTVSALVLFVLRAVVLWYFKIGELVSLLREIRDRLPPPSA
jgi:hypothetical protein